MINSIIESVSIALNAEFGDAYKVYAENNKQGFQEPCFFIQCINPTHDLFLGLVDSQRKRYFRQNQFCIQYFPQDELQPRNEIHSVCERLEFCLEWITNDGDLVRGTQMHYEIVDDVLSFFVNYDLFIHVLTDKTATEEIELNQSVESEDV